MSQMEEEDLPPMTPQLDEYLKEVATKIKKAEVLAQGMERTSDYTVTKFGDTKRDRLWAMKEKEELIDAVFRTADGTHQESVHIDFLLELEPREPFFSKSNALSTGNLPLYDAKPGISASELHQLVYFAYNRRCQLTDDNSMALTLVAAKYGISPMVQFCLAHLLDHCSLKTAFKAYELSCKAEFANKRAQQSFKKYIEDHFEELWEDNKVDLLNLSFPLLTSILKWNKLNLKSESTVWLVILDWVAKHTDERLQHLPYLLQNCLRIGRLAESYVKEYIFSSQIYLAQDGLMKAATQEYYDKLSNSSERKLAIKDGHGLMYSKSIIAFRPRETRQLLLAAGGWVDGKTTALIEVYDHQSNLWLSSSVKLGQAVSYFGFELLDSTVYVFGGSNGRDIFKTVSACDLSKSSAEWKTKASMHERRCYVSSAVLNGHIYAIGGFNQQQRMRKCERFDPQANQWTIIADLNYARSDASTVAHGGRVYIAGGINENNIEQSVEVYSPESNTWTLVKAMATPRTSFSMTHFSKRIWAIGGNDGEQRLNSCESYDPEKDIWTPEKAMVHSRSTFKAIQFNGELFAVGGYNGQSPISNVEKYVPDSGWTKVRHLRHERSGMALLVIPNTLPVFKI